MIAFEDMDKRLQQLGKDRAWLETVTPYKANSIRQALAPSGGARGERIQKILSDAIEAEERRQKNEGGVLAPGIFQIFQNEEQLARADQASRITHAASLADFCREAILIRAQELIDAERKTSFSLVADAANPSPPAPPQKKTTYRRQNR